MRGSIYKIQNLVNGKTYVGFTTNLNRRIKCHKNRAFVSLHKTKLYDAMRKYGWDNFQFSVVYESKDVEHTKNVMENYFIAEYDSIKNGYNMTLGGDGTLGVVPWNKGISVIISEETKKKISSALKGKNVGENNGMYGKTPHNKGVCGVVKRSYDAVEKTRLKNIGMKRKEGTGNKIAATKIGRKRVYREDGTHYYGRLQNAN